MIKQAVAATLAVSFMAGTPASAQWQVTPTEKAGVGLYLGSQLWQSKAAGLLGANNTLVDFQLEKQQQINYLLDVKHPYTGLPQLRVSTTRLHTAGQTRLTQTLGFGDKSFSTGESVTAAFNGSYVDYSLYYDLVEHDQFGLALGLSARDFDADVTISGASRSTGDNCTLPNPGPDSPCTNAGNSALTIGHVDTTSIKPMGFAAGRLRLPSTHLQIFAEANLLLQRDQRFTDYQLGISYSLPRFDKLGVTLNLGYRSVTVELDKLNSLSTDLQFNGAFAGILAHF